MPVFDPTVFVRENPLPKTRNRVFGEQSFKNRSVISTTFNNGLIDVQIVKSTVTVKGTQTTTSVGHPFLRSKQRGKTDIGGDFFTRKSYVRPLQVTEMGVANKTLSLNQPIQCRFSGVLLPTDPSTVSYPPSMSSSKQTLMEAGTTAIANCKPTNPIASLSTTLIELAREGVPHMVGSTLWREQAGKARTAGGEYLNVQFGWQPLIKEVSAFASGVSNSQKVVKDSREGVGKLLKRRYDFPVTETVTSTPLSPSNPFGFGSSNFHTGSRYRMGQRVLERKVSQRRWFSGAFTYFLPDNELVGKSGEYALLAKRLGGELTPEVLWNVAPWSWAVDWFSNTGDVISNWNSFHRDGLLMAYGYIMEHTTVSDTYTMEGALDSSGSPIIVQPLTFVTETKLRYAATPYGFGLTYDGLSGFQQSIMAALGLTKFRR